MSKHKEKLKNQLTELAKVVNAFQSEAVQVRIVDWLLHVMELEKTDDGGLDFFIKGGHQIRSGDKDMLTAKSKKPGATKILNQLLSTDFFTVPHSIAEIVDYCNGQFDAGIKATELSGILLKLVKENRLKRERSNDNNRFEYIRV